MANHKQTENNKFKNFKALNFAFELGFWIAIPIVIFGILGRLADKFFQTSPFGLLSGILISIIVSSFLVYKKSIKILNN